MSDTTTAYTSVPDNLPVLLTTKQAAGLLCCCTKQVRDMCAEGTLPAVKVGAVWRVNRDSLLRQYGLAG